MTHAPATSLRDASPDAGSPGHLPKLDGVRAFAVLGVMLFHASWLQCGWVGVQAFFVLSGFLITRILLRSKERLLAAPADTGRAERRFEYFTTFYWRRSLRIFPLYFAFVAGLILVHAATGHPSQLGADLPWLLTYTINIERIFPGYHNAGTHSHLWSLAVEEQFYLLWPAVVWLLPRLTLRRAVWGLILAGPLLRGVTGWIAFEQWHHLPHAGEVVYNLLTSHLDAFAAGAAVALGAGFFHAHSLGKLAGTAVFTLAAGMSLLLIDLRPLGIAGFNSLGYPLNMSWDYQYVWGYSLLNLTFALLIAILTQAPQPGGRDLFRFLEMPAIAYLGRISYGLYVFHGPVQVLVARLWHVPDYTAFPISALAVSILLTVAIAAASFHFMESWFLKLKDRPPRWNPAFAPTLSAKDGIGG